MLAIARCALLSTQLSETITVSRLVVGARVTRLHGQPITDLPAEDFVVTIAGKRAVVESISPCPPANGSSAFPRIVPGW